MSIVTVHGPNTMYTTGAGTPIQSSPAGATAVQSPTNGLVVNMSASGPRGGTNPADYAWTASASGVCVPTTGPNTVVTFPAGAAGSAQTITLTVSGAGTPPLANGAYVTTVTPVTGAPRMVQQSVEGDEEEDEEPEAAAEEEYFDPADFTVEEVLEWAQDNPEEVPNIIEAEQAGKARVTLLRQLEDMRA